MNQAIYCDYCSFLKYMIIATAMIITTINPTNICGAGRFDIDSKLNLFKYGARRYIPAVIIPVNDTKSTR